MPNTYGGKYLEDEDYKPICEKLINAIPEGVGNEFRHRLEDYLKHGNQFSLRTRLKEIFEKNEILSAFIEERDTFINKVVDTRNHYTHWDEKLKERATTRPDLYHLTKKVKLLLETCILTELGFGSEEVRGLLLRKYEASYDQ